MKINIKKYFDHFYQLVSVGLNFVFIMAVAYFNDMSAFGQFTVDFATAGILAVLLKFGLDSFFFRFRRVDGFHFSIRNVLVIFIPISLFVIIFALWSTFVSAPIIVLAAALAIDEILLSVSRYEGFSKEHLLTRNVLLVSRLIFVPFIPEHFLIPFCFITSAASCLIFGLFFSWRYYSSVPAYRNHLETESLNQKFLFTGKAAASSLLGVLALKADILFLSVFFSYEMIGRYELGARWGFIASIPITIFSAANAPYLAKLNKRSKYKSFLTYYRSSQKKIFYVTNIYVASLVLSSCAILNFGDTMMSQGTSDSLLIATIIAVGHGFASFYGPSGTALVTLGRPGLHLLRIVFSLILFLCLSTISYPILGLLGVALSVSITVALASLISFLKINEILTKEYQFESVGST